MPEINLVAAVAIAGLAASAGVGAASAADIGTVPYGKTPAYVVPAYDWSGGYAGLNAGFGWGKLSDTAGLGAPSLFTDNARLNMNGVLGGAQIGYNLQMQNWMVGLEADLQGANQKSSHSFTCRAGVCTPTINFGAFVFRGPAVSATSSQKLDLFGTVRGRAGIALIPEVLLYATGGFAYGQVHTDTTLAGAVRQQNYNPGWVVGAGVQGALGGGWSVRLEYLYLDLGKVSGVFNSSIVAAGGGTLVQGFDTRVTDNIVRLGLDYAFTGPVISKY
jgi:outer membrane immunogenic protein